MLAVFHFVARSFCSFRCLYPSPSLHVSNLAILRTKNAPCTSDGFLSAVTQRRPRNRACVPLSSRRFLSTVLAVHVPNMHGVFLFHQNRKIKINVGATPVRLPAQSPAQTSGRPGLGGRRLEPRHHGPQASCTLVSGRCEPPRAARLAGRKLEKGAARDIGVVRGGWALAPGSAARVPYGTCSVRSLRSGRRRTCTKILLYF